jgi:hypothetical protein
MTSPVRRQDPIEVDPSLRFRDAPLVYRVALIADGGAFVAMFVAVIARNVPAMRVTMSAVGVALAFHGFLVMTNLHNAAVFEMRWFPKFRWLAGRYDPRTSAYPVLRKAAGLILLGVGIVLVVGAWVADA